MEISKKNKLPKAIAKEKDGIVLYWCEEHQVAGLHINGLARLGEWNVGSCGNLIKRLEAVGEISLLQVEIITESGLRTVGLITESSLGVVFDAIADSKCSQKIKSNFRSIDRKFSQAGFKLLVMLELAPQQLAAQVQQHAMPQTFAQALFLAAQQQAEIEALERDKKLLEGEIEVCNETIQEQAEVVDDIFNYSSIIRIAKFNKISEKNFNWRKLKSASLAMGIEIKSCPDPHFDKKNLYHHDAWRVAYPEANLPETTTLKIDDSLR